LFDINDYAVYIVNNKRTIPLEPGPWCALGDTAFCEQFSGIKLPTPDSFFLVYEDMAYNSPFDGMILAQPLPQGAWKLSHVGSNPHGYRHQLRDPLGAIIADPFKKGFTWNVQGIPTSYGMNSRSARFTTDPYKVLVLDYGTPVADVVGLAPDRRYAYALEIDGEPLFVHVARRAGSQWRAMGECGLVVGATYPDELRRVRDLVGDMPLLVPGIGAQGGDVAATVAAGADANGYGMVINSSRAVLYASAGDDFAEAARAAAIATREEIRSAATSR
jgi:hypothetical protein